MAALRIAQYSGSNARFAEDKHLSLLTLFYSMSNCYQSAVPDPQKLAHVSQDDAVAVNILTFIYVLTLCVAAVASQWAQNIKKTSRTIYGLNVFVFAKCTWLNRRFYKDVEYTQTQRVKVYSIFTYIRLLCKDVFSTLVLYKHFCEIDNI